jgi:hypothetical protein
VAEPTSYGSHIGSGPYRRRGSEMAQLMEVGCNTMLFGRPLVVVGQCVGDEWVGPAATGDMMKGSGTRVVPTIAAWASWSTRCFRRSASRVSSRATSRRWWVLVGPQWPARLTQSGFERS